MFDLNENYDPDEILMDPDNDLDLWQAEDIRELSFENEIDALEGLSFLTSDVESTEVLFADE